MISFFKEDAKLRKVYFYVERGLDIINTFRNLFLAIIALYLALKFENTIWAVVMFVVSMPILAVIGYYNVHYIAKIRDKLSIKFGTHYGIKSFDYQARTVELLEEISKKLI